MPEAAAGSRRRFLALASGRGALAVVALATTRLLTELLSPAEVGRVTMLFTVTGLFALALVNPVGMFVNRRIHAWNRDGVLGTRFRDYFGYVAVVALVAVLALVLAYRLGGTVAGIALPWLVLLVAGSLLVNTIHQTLLPSFNLLGHTGWFVAPTTATAFLGLGAAVLLVHRFGPAAEWWVLGLLAAQVAVTLAVTPAFLRVTNRTSPRSPAAGALQGAASFAVPLALAVGLWWAQSQGYRFILEQRAGVAALGLFAVGYGVASSVFSLFESVVTQYLQPAFYRQAAFGGEPEQAEAWNRYARVMFPSLLLTLFFVLALAPYLAKILLGPDFQSGVQYVIWGAFVEGGRVFVAAVGLVAHAAMDTRSLLPANAVGAAAAVGLSLVLVPFYGPHGAGGALLAGMVLHGVVLVVAMRARRAVSIPGFAILKGAVAGSPLVALAVAAAAVVGPKATLVEAFGVLAVGSLLFLVAQWFLLNVHIERRGVPG